MFHSLFLSSLMLWQIQAQAQRPTNSYYTMDNGVTKTYFPSLPSAHTSIGADIYGTLVHRGHVFLALISGGDISDTSLCVQPAWPLTPAETTAGRYIAFYTSVEAVYCIGDISVPNQLHGQGFIGALVWCTVWLFSNDQAVQGNEFSWKRWEYPLFATGGYNQYHQKPALQLAEGYDRTIFPALIAAAQGYTVNVSLSTLDKHVYMDVYDHGYFMYLLVTERIMDARPNWCQNS